MKFITNRINPKYYNLIGIILIVAIAGVLYAGHYYRLKRAEDFRNQYVLLDLKPIQTQYGWGYEITTNGKLYIHQEFIPAVSGKRGFASKEQALLVGNKVLSKIRLKENPPTLTVQELSDLGVINDSVAKK
jgi:hypothetical protein